MPAQTDDDTIRNLVQSAEARLERAETYVSKTRPELTCEDAQQTAELALKALIKANRTRIRALKPGLSLDTRR